MAIISVDCMKCHTNNQIDSSLAVAEGGILMFNCSCTNCGERLVSVDAQNDSKFGNDIHPNG